MGKIPEYQRSKFASSYVGGGQVDTSGVELTEGLTKAAGTVMAVEQKKLEERAQIAVDQQANKAVLDYSIASQRQIKTLEQEYADNPGGFAEAVTKNETDLMTTYMGAIPDERVRARAGKAMTSIIAQHQNVALEWADAQMSVKAQIDSQESLRLGEIAAAETTEEVGLGSAVKAIYDTVELMGPDVDTATKNKLFNESARAGVIGHLNNVVEKDPFGTAQKLERGDYNKITYETADGKMQTVPVSSDIIDKYKGIAKTYALGKKKEKDFNILLNASGEVADMAQGFLGGEKTLTDVLNKQEQLRREEVPKDVMDGMDALVRVGYALEADDAQLDDVALGDTYAEWANLEQVIKKRKNSKGEWKDPQNYTTNLLKARTKMYNRVAEGKIRRKTAQTIDAKLWGPLFKSVAEQKGQFWWNDDPNAKYYKVLTEKVNNMELSSAQKLQAKVNAFSAFMERAVEAEEKSGEVSEEQYMQFARDAFNQTNQTYFPKTAAAMTEDSVNATASNKTGVTAVHSNPTDVSGANTLPQQQKPEVGAKRMFYGEQYTFTGTGWKRIK